MTTIYVVTSGEYSEYGIRGLFSDRGAAQGFIDLVCSEYPDEYHTDGLRIEDWQLDWLSGTRKGQAFAAEIRLCDGEVSDRPATDVLITPHGEICEEVPGIGPEDREARDGGVIASHYITYSLISQEHARRLAAEKRQEEIRQCPNHPVFTGQRHEPT